MTDRRRSEALVAYQQGLANSAKYQPEEQIRLKTRVFETFDSLLKHRGEPGLVPNLRLVDLGAADGALVEVCKQRGLVVTGLDAVDGIDFEKDAIPLPDASVDVVTAVSIIEHLRCANIFLSEIRRILRPGGSLLLVTPNWYYSWRDFYNDPTHYHPYTPLSLAKELTNHGFSDIYVVPWIVKKPAWMWDLKYAFFVARWLIPFRGDAPAIVPEALKGRSGTILAFAKRT
jgi:SAM-dependent methyltransferase